MNKLSQEALKEYLTNSIQQWGAKYELQYVDYDKETWTVPISLTEERIERIISDVSIRNIRLSFCI